ncbi:MAG: ATP-binding protein [Elusimicrobia bacterium]|nr:ATP-binding protein [Elusimicrobiota bacterium]
MNSTIYPRTILSKIRKYLYTEDIIVLHGARQVGKTFILYSLKKILDDEKQLTHFMDIEDSRLIPILEEGVEKFKFYLEEEGFNFQTLKGKKKLFVFIDEIQYLKNPSSFLKLVKDHHPYIKLIVSGSSSFNIKAKFGDSLVGRTVNFEIFNLSFEEFLNFHGVSFPLKVVTEKKIQELLRFFELYSRCGGYPKIALTRDLEMKEKYLQQIIDTYIKKDVRDLAVIKDIGKFNKLLEALAAQSGQLLNVMELSNTCAISKQTVEHYLFILEETYVIKLLRPFSTNIRSELFKTPKIYFYDTGLMQMLWLKSLPKQLIGNVFETAIFSELVKKYGPESLGYWRTKDKKEIDFVLKIGKNILPIEVKLNFAQFNLSPIKYFLSKYKIDRFKFVALHGSPKDKSYVYPWNL